MSIREAYKRIEKFEDTLTCEDQAIKPWNMVSFSMVIDAVQSCKAILEKECPEVKERNNG